MRDLVIGGRRSRRQHVARAALFAAALAVAAVVVAWFIYRRSVSYDAPSITLPTRAVTAHRGAPGTSPVLRWGDAELGWLGGSIAVLRVAGEPTAIGGAHGRLLGAAVADVARPMTSAINDAVSHGGWIGSLFRGMRTEWKYRFIDDGLTERDRRWVAAIAGGATAAGAPVGFDALVRDQAALDVGAASAATAEGELRALARSLTFVSPQGGPIPGRLWIGRSFALPGLADGGDAVARVPVVSLVRPAGKLAWAGVGWPGLAGVVTAINAEGVVICVHPSRTGDVRATRAARPIALLARDVMEQAADLDAAIVLIETTPTLGAAAFVVADGKTGRWAVVERGPARVHTSRSPAEPAVGDILRSSPFADDPELDRATRVLPTGDRVKRATRILRTPPVDAAAAAAVLRDRRSVDGAGRPAGHRGVIEDPAAVHAAIIDPTAMVLWVADGGPGARMRAIDLRHELRGEGTQATPPADIAADPEVEPDRDDRLRAARGELRGARRAFAGGSLATAHERASRAVIRAPQLPETLELVARIARARGDAEAARAAVTAWLDGGADSPQAEQELRGLAGR